MWETRLRSGPILTGEGWLGAQSHMEIQEAAPQEHATGLTPNPCVFTPSSLGSRALVLLANICPMSQPILGD